MRAEQLLAADRGRPETGAVKGIPERKGLVPSGRDACDFQGNFDGIRSTGREQHLGQIARRNFGEFFSQRGCRLVGEAARCKWQLVHLCGDCRFQPRMAIADMVNVVAMKIEITLALNILNPGTFGF